MGKGGWFILAPAKPLRPETPMANAVAMDEAFAFENEHRATRAGYGGRRPGGCPYGG